MTQLTERHPVQIWNLALAPTPESVPEARHRSRDTLATWGVPAAAADIAELVVSELVTNAIRICDAHHLVQLRIIGNDEVVRVEVDDPDSKQPRAVAASLEAESGRGLLLVRTVADEFGVSGRTPAGKTVWAVIKAGDQRWR